MRYKLAFKRMAKREWDQLDPSIRSMFAKKLKACTEQPHRENDRLRGMKDCYKIKLRQAGYRLVYQVRDEKLIVVVVAVGRRDRYRVYRSAIRRIGITPRGTP